MAATCRRLARRLTNRKKKKKNFVVGAEEELVEVFATLTATARNVLKFYDIKNFFYEAAVEIRRFVTRSCISVCRLYDSSFAGAGF